MRVVFDTNVVVDGLADETTPQGKLLATAAAGGITALVTPAIQREYTRILWRLTKDPEQQKKVSTFLAAAEGCKPKAALDVVIDDQEDRKFVEAALGGAADMIITRDRHLLEIGEIGSIVILPPVEAWWHWQDATSGQEEWQSWTKGLGLLLWLVIAVLPSSLLAASDSLEAQRAEKEATIAELTQKIAELQEQKNTASAEAELIDRHIAVIAHRLEKAHLELQETQQLLSTVAKKREQTKDTIAEFAGTIEQKKIQLRGLIRLLYAKEQVSLINVWLASGSLSEVLAERAAVRSLHDESTALMQDVQAKAQAMREQEKALAEQGEELTAASRLLAAQQQALAAQKNEQAEFLAAKRAQQVSFEQKIVEAKAARQEIEAGLFALKSSGVQVSFTTAADMAQHAGDVTGVRPSLLLAVLKVESNMGINIGSGTFPDDMHPASREPFLRLAAALGRDPAEMPISRALSYGWGGAMGPAQIMPQTWEGIAPRLSALLKKVTPDPYDLTDAFVATALILQDKGAAGSAGEREAVGRYLAGPHWQNYSWYIDRVFAVAAEYAKEGLS